MEVGGGGLPRSSLRLDHCGPRFQGATTGRTGERAGSSVVGRFDGTDRQDVWVDATTLRVEV